MTLRTRLFLWVGALFLLLTLISYFFPRLIVREEVRSLQDSFGRQVQKEREGLYRERKEDFSHALTTMLEALKGSRDYVLDSPLLRSQLEKGSVPDKTVWSAMMQQIVYTPYVQAIQVESDQETWAIDLENPRLYPIDSLPLSAHLAFVQAVPAGAIDSPQIGPYIGIRLREDPSISALLYYLYPVELFFNLTQSQVMQFLDSSRWESLRDELQGEVKEIERSLEAAKILTVADLVTWMHQRRGTESAPVALPKIAPAMQKQVSRTMPIATDPAKGELHNVLFNSLKLYAQLIVSLLEQSPFESELPQGMVSFPSLDIRQGLAFFNAELFFEHPVLLPSASNPRIVANPMLNDFLVVEEVEVSAPSVGSKITLGSSLIPLLVGMATGNELAVTVTPSGFLHAVFDREGFAQNPQLFAGVDFSTLFPSLYGQIFLQNEPYYFFQLQSERLPGLHLFIFRSDASEAMYTLKDVVSQRLTSSYYSFSFQLMIVSVLVLLVALIILAIVSARITKPLEVLAKATQRIAQGDVNLQLPEGPKEGGEITTLYTNFQGMLRGLQDKERLRSILDRMVSREIATEILKGHLRLGGENKIVTVLFADIRQFTHHTEHMEPQALIEQVNGFMTRMTKLIEREGGVIDKYIGDEIMALWGTPISCENGPKRALLSGLAMFDALREWNVERAEAGLFPMEVGIGIHTGRVVAGNMGSESRLNYTVLGANVNLAARLCSQAAPMQILTTAETLEASGLKDRLHMERLPDITYKGFSSPIPTFSITGWR